MDITHNFLTASNGERVEFVLLGCLFSVAGSYIYQKKFLYEISSDILIYSGFGSLITYLCIIGPFLWNQLAVILVSFLFGVLFTYRVT